MHDHIDCWNDDIPVPVGRFAGNVWIGDLSHRQLNEIISRAGYYEPFTGEDYRANRWICDAAKRVLKTLEQVVPAMVAEWRKAYAN
jgi:hypothetical protein